jgi:hypothetical protein
MMRRTWSWLESPSENLPRIEHRLLSLDAMAILGTMLTWSPLHTLRTPPLPRARDVPQLEPRDRDKFPTQSPRLLPSLFRSPSTHLPSTLHHPRWVTLTAPIFNPLLLNPPLRMAWPALVITRWMCSGSLLNACEVRACGSTFSTSLSTTQTSNRLLQGGWDVPQPNGGRLTSNYLAVFWSCTHC